jgi:serine/threonine-protein phosphatase 2A activator
LREVLPEKLHRAIPEIEQYLYESFGNPTRIDYGTGHEMAFLMFLCCMFKIGAFKQDDEVAVVIKVFNRYFHFHLYVV